MHAQALIVALLVLLCAGYALWTLMPAAARRAVATRLLRWPLPAGLARVLARALGRSGGCACDGCGSNRAAKEPAVVRLHRPRP
jgi:hypothetical protein